MSQQITYPLARFIAETNFSDLPKAVIDDVKAFVLDALACGFVGAKLPWSTIVRDVAAAEGGHAQCSIFGQEDQLTATQATLVNGVMISGFESEHIGHNAHPSATVVPAALAIAERDGLSGEALLVATALAYESVCRIGAAQTNAVETERGFHNPAANGPFSAAAVAGRLLGLDAEDQERALGIAGSYSGGLIQYAVDGSMTKRLHLGHASQGGLEAALLAQRGFTGPRSILEGRYGYFNAFSPSPKEDLVLDGLARRWLLHDLTIKRYPCHVSSQAVVDTLTRLKGESLIDPDSITGLHLRSARHLEDRFLNRSPDTDLGAQYSLPFSMAVAIHRNLNDPLQYDTSVLSDPRICGLAERITWETAEASSVDEIEVISTGGAIAAEVSLRSFGAIGARFDGVVDKFHRYSAGVIDARRRNSIVEIVRALEHCEDIASLMALIRP